MTITSSLRFLYILGDLAYCVPEQGGFDKGGMAPYFAGIEKRTEKEKDNLFLLNPPFPPPDFWTFRHLWQCMIANFIKSCGIEEATSAILRKVFNKIPT